MPQDTTSSRARAMRSRTPYSPYSSETSMDGNRLNPRQTVRAPRMNRTERRRMRAPDWEGGTKAGQRAFGRRDFGHGVVAWGAERACGLRLCGFPRRKEAL